MRYEDTFATCTDGLQYREIVAGDFVVVAWSNSPSGRKLPMVILFTEPGGRRRTEKWQIEFTSPQIEHLAFVRGSMPSYVYADWLEENFDPPGELLSLLRSPANATESVSNGVGATA